MPSFPVGSYLIRLEIERRGTPVVMHRNRIIEIVGAPLGPNGLVTRALLYFSTRWDAVTLPVGYLDTTTPNQPRLTGWFPSAEFSTWYDVLRSEKPISLGYEVTPINGASYVSIITLGTSNEPAGEGPADVM